jgi:hypothetical protein
MLTGIGNQRLRFACTRLLDMHDKGNLALLRSIRFPQFLSALQTRPLTASSTTGSNERVLYQRDPNTYVQPRAALSLSWLSCVYSTWYAVDFLPTVNNTGIPELYVNPLIGTAGCAITYLLAGLGCFYVRQMVSKIVVVENSTIQVYRHSLPFMIPSSAKPTEYRVGEVFLDYTSDDVQQMMDRFESDHVTTAHIPLKIANRRWPLAIYVSNWGNIPDKELFREVLYYGSLARPKERKQKAVRTPTRQEPVKLKNVPKRKRI